MRVDIVTIFPGFFEGPLRYGLLGKALDEGSMDVKAHDLRDHGRGRHRSVDDEPYGGGPGMVMRPEPIFECVESLRDERSHVVLLSPRGVRLDQTHVQRLAAFDHLVLVCGRYEGVDERVAEHLVDDEISIGDYVLAGGEAAALVVVETVSRLQEGVLGNAESLAVESHVGGGLEFPQYTRPAEFRGWRVPPVLLSGDHGAIAAWRADAASAVTADRRPDLNRPGA